jgi:ATP-dependent DNA helicase RecG
MRPAILFPLFAPVDTLPAVGPSVAKTLNKLAGPRIVDLLWHLPQGIVDRRLSSSIADVEPRRRATLRVRVLEHEPPRTRRRPYRILCGDASGGLILVFFNARPEYLLKTLPPGETRIVSGMVDMYGEGLQMVHPVRVGRRG